MAAEEEQGGGGAGDRDRSRRWRWRKRGTRVGWEAGAVPGGGGSGRLGAWDRSRRWRQREEEEGVGGGDGWSDGEVMSDSDDEAKKGKKGEEKKRLTGKKD